MNGLGMESHTVIWHFGKLMIGVLWLYGKNYTSTSLDPSSAEMDRICYAFRQRLLFKWSESPLYVL